MAIPSLYGLENSNRENKDLWGKNQFNSSFPVSLCCYMRDNNYSPVYIYLEKNFQPAISDNLIKFDTVFGSNKKYLTYNFEHPFLPFKNLIYGQKIGNIDLVTLEGTKYLRPLEIKLTVLPDQATCKEESSSWGCELVLRPISTSYAILNIFSSVKQKGQIDLGRDIVESVAASVESWQVSDTLLQKKEEILHCLSEYLKEFYQLQSPFLIQPIWKTAGKSPSLVENCFDIFSWSDFMLCKIIIDSAKKETLSKTRRVSRTLRECARMFRCLYDLHSRGKVNIDNIYKSMSYGSQTDKAFAISGKQTHFYMKHRRLTKPILERNVLKKIILNGGEKLLSPERRFDATVYFTCKEIFD